MRKLLQHKTDATVEKMKSRFECLNRTGSCGVMRERRGEWGVIIRITPRRNAIFVFYSDVEFYAYVRTPLPSFGRVLAHERCGVAKKSIMHKLIEQT